MHEKKRVVLVTGAAGGVGVAVTRLLIEKGVHVVALVRYESDLNVFVSEGLNIERGFVLDIQSEEEVDGFFEALKAACAAEWDFFGMVHCAGISYVSPMETLPLDELQSMLNTNLVASVRLIQKAVPLLRQSGGKIVVLGSVAGRVAGQLVGGYSASKFGLRAVVDAFRRELAGTGIDVSLIEPGGIVTAMMDKETKFVRERLKGLTVYEEEHYGDQYRKFEKMISGAKDFSSSPEKVAGRAVSLVTRPGKLRPYYRVGSDSKLITFLDWILPMAVLDRILVKL